MGHFCSKIVFLCILFVLIFMLTFGIAFARPPVPILGFGRHFMVFFGVILKTFSQMLRNPKNATLSSEMLVLAGVGPPVLHYFC